MNIRGRLHDVTLTIDGTNFTQSLVEPWVNVTWEYVDLGGIWRASTQVTLRDHRGANGTPSTLSWEVASPKMLEGKSLVISLGSDTIFNGRILSVSAPAEEGQYIDDWRVTVEAGDALYYLNYENRPMGNWGDTSLDTTTTLGTAINTILVALGSSLSNPGSLTQNCNFNLASADQQGLVSGMAGPLAYQLGQWVLAADGTTITAYQEQLTGSAHHTYGISDTWEFAPIPDSEPLVNQIEMLTNTQVYINQGSDNYSIDGRVAGEGFVNSGQWINNNFREVSTEYRSGTSLDPSDPNATIYNLTVVNIKRYNSQNQLFEILNFSFGHLAMFYRTSYKSIPSGARSFSRNDPGNNPAASECWHRKITTITLANGTIEEENSTREEYLSEQIIPREERGFTAFGLTKINGTEFEIYGPVTSDRDKRIVEKSGGKWFVIDQVYDFGRNEWIAGNPQASDSPIEPEIKPFTLAGNVYSLETQELTATASLSTAQPNPNQQERMLVSVDFAGNQTNLNNLATHYATLVSGRRRKWRISVPYFSSLLASIKLPGRRISWSPDVHNRNLKYLLTGASVRLTDRVSLIDLELTYLGVA